MNAQPEYHSHEEFINRTRKLKEIRDLGIEPYPNEYIKTHEITQVVEAYAEKDVGNSEDAAEGKTDEVSVAGRLVLFRAMGKNAFGHVNDGMGKIQIMVNRDATVLNGYTRGNESDPKPIKVIEKKFDLGDIIGVKGHLFRTQKGELTIFATEVTLLCKSLLPLPDKHAGLVDKEMRYRKRWTDLITHNDVMQTFLLRSRIVSIIRRSLEEKAFVEVETPVLQNMYGGAAARPFTTTFNALDKQEVFLRISLEIALKKLLVGGLPRVFEIGKVFRNESIDKSHNPEFTLLEAYAAYWDYNDMMELVENLFEKVALELFGTTKITVGKENEEEGVVIDVKAPWARLSMKDSLRKFAAIDIDAMSDDEMRDILIKIGREEEKKIKGSTRGELCFMLFEEKVEHLLLQPHHITDHPIETTPLCKLHRDPEQRKQGIVERFESFILGQEICNAYSELNDPELQRDLLVKQEEKRGEGDEEASPLDEEFIEAICQGMPPAGGIGIGIDRMVMLFANVPSIRDVLFFPFMKG
jgi:lysyl-tRNA synthetase, class II